MLSIGTVVMGVQDMPRAVAFWSELLDYVVRDDEVSDDWTVLQPHPHVAGTRLALDVSDTPVQEHPRVHLDLFAADAAEQAKEVERVVALGGSRVDWDLYPEDPDFVVVADTEGNRFCIIDLDH